MEIKLSGRDFSLIKQSPYFKQTDAESAAGVTPVNYYYEPGDVRRYGAISDNSTDSLAAFEAARSQHSNGGRPILIVEDGSGYRISNVFTIGFDNARVETRGRPLIRTTNASAAVISFTGGTSGHIRNCYLGDCILDGGNRGLYVRTATRGEFRARCRNQSFAGLYAEFSICNTFYITCSTNVDTFTTTPTYGIFLTRRNANEGSTANTFICPILEGITNGMLLEYADQNVFIGGTVEGCTTYGINEGTGSATSNTFIGLAMEGNGTEDWRTSARGSRMIGSYTNTAIHFIAGAMCELVGGLHQLITVDSGVSLTRIQNVEYDRNAVGGSQLIDNGTATVFDNVRTAAGALTANKFNNSNFSAATAVKRVGVTYSTSITINASLGDSFNIVATDGVPFAINAPTNPTSGQRMTITIVNSSGGALGAVTWNAAFVMAAWTNPANGFRRAITFEYSGSAWVEINRNTADI